MDLAYDKYLTDQSTTLEENWKNFQDSITNVEQPFIDELDNLTQQYKDGKVSYDKYLEGFNLLKELKEKHQSEASNLPNVSTKDFEIYKATEDSLNIEAGKVIDLLNAGKISKNEAIKRLGEHFTLTDK